jgi:hypothetical protein
VESYAYIIAARWYLCHPPNVLFRGLIVGLETGNVLITVWHERAAVATARWVVLHLVRVPICSLVS